MNDHPYLGDANLADLENLDDELDFIETKEESDLEDDGEEDESSKEDWDFPDELYESDEEKDTESIESIKKFKRARISGIRSRFSNGEAEMNRIGKIGELLSKYSIEVNSRSHDINKLWKYYAILDEFWQHIRHVFGEIVNQEIDAEFSLCENLLEKNQGKSVIDIRCHKELSLLRKNLYQLRQLGNFGYEIERTNRSVFSKAKRSITQ